MDGGDLEPETRVGDATGERRAFGEQALRALRQLGQAGAQGGGGALRTERCDRDAVRRQPVERQIHAIEGPEITAAILEVIDDLQGGADRVR